MALQKLRNHKAISLFWYIRPTSSPLPGVCPVQKSLLMCIPNTFISIRFRGSVSQLNIFTNFWNGNRKLCQTISGKKILKTFDPPETQLNWTFDLNIFVARVIDVYKETCKINLRAERKKMYQIWGVTVYFDSRIPFSLVSHSSYGCLPACRQVWHNNPLFGS